MILANKEFGKDRKLGPVLLLALTNHALDHMLRSVLDGDVTKNIVRLGSRSTDPVICEHKLEAISRTGCPPCLSRAINRGFGAMKTIQDVSFTK